MAEESKNKGAAPGAAPATLEQALEQNKALATANKELASKLKDSKTVIAELKSELKEAREKAAQASTVPVVEVDGVKYQVNHGAAGIGSADEIAADPNLAKKLLAKKGQNVLTELK